VVVGNCPAESRKSPTPASREAIDWADDGSWFPVVPKYGDRRRSQSSRREIATSAADEVRRDAGRVFVEERRARPLSPVASYGKGKGQRKLLHAMQAVERKS
jgi:hypothetical protein